MITPVTGQLVRLLREDGSIVNVAHVVGNAGVIMTLAGEWQRGVYLSFATAVPRKVMTTNEVPDQTDYGLYPLLKPAAGKAWKLFRFEMNSKTSTTTQNITLNGDELGYYVTGNTYGTLYLPDNFGDGVTILNEDSFTIRHTNTSGETQTLECGMFVVEYDLPT